MLTWVSRSRFLASCNVSQLSQFHTSSAVERSRNWEMKNRIVYPPQTPEEPRRPATLSGISSDGFGEHRNTVLKNKTYDRYTTEVEIFHCRKQIKYSKDKMWYLAKMIRGMSIDQAIAQLEFNDKKGAKIMREVLLEAQDLAVRNHNVEYKSNLYIGQGFIASVQDVKVLGARAGNGSRSKVHRITIYRSVQGITIQKCARMSDDPTQSFSNKGKYLKRIRYHGRGMFGIMDRVYCHYYVKLVEGPPPPPEPAVTGFDQAKKYVQQLRDRTIIHGL